MDNFGLKVKATNVVGSGDGVEVYVHCDDHDIVFNASIPFDKSIIDSDSSLRSEDKGDDMSTLVGTVLSGFEYRAQKEKYDNLYKFFKDNEDTNIQDLQKRQLTRHKIVDMKMNILYRCKYTNTSRI